MEMERVYFDHIAATPLHPLVLEAMIPHLKDHYGNPQSLHFEGQSAQESISESRQLVADLINAGESEIFFTSSGSESNNFAIKGLALAQQGRGNHIIVSAIEHQSVLYSVKMLEKFGFSVTAVPVDRHGLVDPEDVKKALNPETVLVSVILASSEVGSLQPIKEIAGICRENKVICHTDAVAAAGNIPLDVNELGVDALSLAADQFYGPKGAAALYLRRRTRILPFIDGGIQESGRRAGTENVAGIVGMGRAAALASEHMERRMSDASRLRDLLIRRMTGEMDHVILTGHPEKRLPHQASFCVEFIEGEGMLLFLDRKGIAVSSGSACTSRALKASHVLLAMGFDHALAQGSLSFGLIEDNTEEDVNYLMEVFPPIVDKLRRMSPLYQKYLEEKK
jgi:cysteine desulfurase